MIAELAKHIETLLLENDCVIIPEFGGFIVHNVSARKDEHEHTFLPPHRALGFNPQLNLNDGLLIQSYMSAYDVNYPQAQQLVDNAVSELRQQLAEQSYVELHGVGRLSYNIEDQFVFSPCESGLLSPSLYGFSAFRMELLPEEAPVSLQTETGTTPEAPKRKRNTLVVRIDRRWLNNAVAVVVALVMFCLLSTPVDNTYIEPENYASVGHVELFNSIRSQSVATSLLPTATKPASAPVKAQPKTTTAAKATATAAKATASAANATASAANASASAANATASAATPVATAQTQQAAPAQPEAKEAKESPAAPAKAQAQPANAPAAPAVQATPAAQAQPAVSAPAAKQPRYHIVVASVPNETDAQQAIQYFATKGYPGAIAVKSDGRVRIALASYTDRTEADARWNEVRKLELFQNAWILTTRN